MVTKKFLRTGTRRYKRLGKGRKKLQRWRKPRGRDNKIREKRKGRARKVEIGYRTKKTERNKINGRLVMIVRNMKEADSVGKGDLIIMAKVGRKKREELGKKIKEKGGQILNVKKMKKTVEKTNESKK
ncbi:MAG: eL32 family ribosomal protein [Candidatus Thorarchaeota archaeon]|jgi:large subunit ribosomal protein L32e